MCSRHLKLPRRRPSEGRVDLGIVQWRYKEEDDKEEDDKEEGFCGDCM
jgi:hypothetical protein